MTAPTRVTGNNSTASTTTTSTTLTGIAQGDLVVAVAELEVDGTPTATLQDGSGTLATMTADLHTTDTTRGIWVFSAVMPQAVSGNATVAFGSWPGSGTRRFTVHVFRAASGEAVPQWSTNRVARKTDIAVEADGWTYDGSSVGHSTLTATDSTRTRPGVAVAVTRGGSARTLTYDFNGDGTADSTGDLWTTDPSTALFQGAYALFDTGSGLVTSGTVGKVLGSQGSNVVASAFVYYVYEVRPQARGRAAAKATAVGTIFKKAEGRARAAAKATARFVSSGAVSTTAQGRGRAAASARATFRNFVSTRTGLSKAAAKATSVGYFIHHPAISAAAADAAAMFFVKKGAEGRARAAAKASATFFANVTVRTPGRGRAAASATARYFYGTAKVAEGRARAAAKATAQFSYRIPSRADGRGRAAASASARFFLTTVSVVQGRARAAARAFARFAISHVPYMDAELADGMHDATLVPSDPTAELREGALR